MDLDIDPCPICGSRLTYISNSVSDPVGVRFELDIGWRTVDAVEYSIPKITHWLLDPCGCILPGMHWVWVSVPGEPIHWLPPDEVDRFMHDRGLTNTP